MPGSFWLVRAAKPMARRPEAFIRSRCNPASQDSREHATAFAAQSVEMNLLPSFVTGAPAAWSTPSSGLVTVHAALSATLPSFHVHIYPPFPCCSAVSLASIVPRVYACPDVCVVLPVFDEAVTRLC